MFSLKKNKLYSIIVIMFLNKGGVDMEDFNDFQKRMCEHNKHEME